MLFSVVNDEWSINVLKALLHFLPLNIVFAA